MRMILMGILALLLFVLVIGGAYLLMADPKPTITHVEKTIPSNTLPR